jgi:hypothetical protein
VVGPDILEVNEDGSLIVIDKSAVPWETCRATIEEWRAVKIEDNIGYGLWQVHKETRSVCCSLFETFLFVQPYDQDEMKKEIAAAHLEGRAVNPANWGRDLRAIMNSFCEAAKAYQQALGPVQFENASEHTTEVFRV